MAKISVRLGLSWRVCIKYAQTMAATKHIQVCEECQTVVLLMGKMHWGLWHLCITEQLLLKPLVYISRLLLSIGRIMPKQRGPDLFWGGVAGGDCSLSPNAVVTSEIKLKLNWNRIVLFQFYFRCNHRLRVCWSCNIANKTTKLKTTKTKTKTKTKT